MTMHLMRARAWLTLTVLGWLVALAACGGSDTPLPPPAPPAMIGAAGGSVSDPSGARVTVPTGALTAAVPIAITMSTQGAPTLPGDLQTGGAMFALTPHGTRFAQPVTVQLPFNAATWPAAVTPALFKTNAAGQWERVAGAIFAAGSVTAQVDSFSWFTVGAQPPAIPPSQQPQSVSVTAGQDATFSVGALGAPPFAYAWQRSDDGGGTWTALTNATARTLTLASTRSAPSGAGGDNGARLRVVVSNGDGATTSQPATLTVTVAVVAPIIGTQPSSVSVVEGASATFTVVATGTNLLHQWQRSTDGGATYADVPGATNASLTLTALNLADSGQRLRAVVSNSAGSVTSDAATLTVTPLVPGGGVAGAVLAAGGTYSLALLKDGTLRSWGGGIGGTLGALGAGASITSRGLPGTVPAMSDVIAVSSGPATVLALRANGEVWGWGYGTFCQLSAGGICLERNHDPLRYLPTPSAGRIGGIAAGSDHTLLLRGDAYAEGAGWNATGALGVPTSSVYIASQSTPVPLATPLVQVVAGSGYSLGLGPNGEVWSWGSNNSGQTGHGDTNTTNTPLRVVLMPPAKALAAGLTHVLALTTTGDLWSWGSNENGKLGQGTLPGGAIVMRVPARIAASGPFVAIAAGAQHSLALHADGSVWAWGVNETGQLGTGSLSPGMSAVPVRVSGLPAGIRAIAAGGGRDGLGHSLALAPDGSVWAWGDNAYGQIGDGSTVRIRPTPVQVPGLNLN